MLFITFKILIGFFLLAISSLLAYTLLKVIATRNTKSVFKSDTFLESMILGSIILSAFIAFLFVGLKTVYLIVPFLIIVYLKIKDQKTILISKYAFFIFFIFSVLFSVINVYGTEYSSMSIPEGDKLFYIHTIIGIENFGNENIYGITQFVKESDSINLYHYYELYLTLFVRKVTSFNYNLILNGIIVSFFLFIFLTTIYTLLRTFIKKKIHDALLIILSILLLSVKGLTVFDDYIFNPFLEDILKFSFWHESFHKILFIAPILLFIFISPISRYPLLLILPSLNFSLLPVSLTMAISIIMYNFFEKSSGKQEIFKNILFFSLSIAFYAFFFKISEKISFPLNLTPHLIYKIFIKHFFTLIYIYLLPIILIVIYLMLDRKKLNFDIRIIFAITTILATLLGYVLLNIDPNGFQVFATPSRPLLLFIFIFLISLIINQGNKILYIVTSVLLMFMIYKEIIFFKIELIKEKTYSSVFINSISKFKFENKIGLGFKNYTNLIDAERLPTNRSLGIYCLLTENAYGTLTANLNDIPAPNGNLPQKVDSLVIRRFSPLWSDYHLNKSKFQNYNNYLLDYVNKRKVEFVIKENNVKIPNVLRSVIKDSIMDFNTKEVFYLTIYNKFEK